MGFFNLYKPKEYKYRYIYYDPKKEAKKEREKQLNAEKGENKEFHTSIRRGTFREMAQQSKNERKDQIRKANIRLVLIIALLIALIYIMLK